MSGLGDDCNVLGDVDGLNTPPERPVSSRRLSQERLAEIERALDDPFQRMISAETARSLLYDLRVVMTAAQHLLDFPGTEDVLEAALSEPEEPRRNRGEPEDFTVDDGVDV